MPTLRLIAASWEVILYDFHVFEDTLDVRIGERSRLKCDVTIAGRAVNGPSVCGLVDEMFKLLNGFV